MPVFTTDQGVIHYETFGRGRPVLLLHGWLGSWNLWRETLEVLGKEFRTYALDLWGFGESGRNNYKVDDFVSLVIQFMDKLGIVRAPLIGHSMGGTVSLSTAIKYPERVVKVTVIGSPIVGSSLNVFLRLSGNPTIAQLVYSLPFVRQGFVFGIGYLAANQGRAMKMIVNDASKVSMNSFFQSIGTLRDTDLRPILNRVEVPTLGIYGRKDIIVHPNQNVALKVGVPHAQVSWYNNAGHFPMLDDSTRFYQDLSKFLNGKQL